MIKLKEFFISRYYAFGHAFRGLWHVLRTQKNAWVHAVVTTLVVIVSLWLQVSTQSWAILVLAIALVWSAEFINTAIEAVVDLASPTHHPLAKTGKDVGAAAVLIAALAAVLIGLLILGPPLWAKLSPFFNR
jgi:diacylglycerol kinase (ATP)